MKVKLKTLKQIINQYNPKKMIIDNDNKITQIIVNGEIIQNRIKYLGKIIEVNDDSPIKIPDWMIEKIIAGIDDFDNLDYTLNNNNKCKELFELTKLMKADADESWFNSNKILSWADDKQAKYHIKYDVNANKIVLTDIFVFKDSIIDAYFPDQKSLAKSVNKHKELINKVFSERK